jgi:hypothetical protein
MDPQWVNAASAGAAALFGYGIRVFQERHALRDLHEAREMRDRTEELLDEADRLLAERKELEGG